LAKRVFRDAPPWARCGMAVKLRDGSWAQCGRWQNEGYRTNPLQQGSPCTQHGDMLFSGKVVYLWKAGHPPIKLNSDKDVANTPIDVS
jgi:hypothetical protein